MAWRWGDFHFGFFCVRHDDCNFFFSFLGFAPGIVALHVCSLCNFLYFMYDYIINIADYCCQAPVKCSSNIRYSLSVSVIVLWQWECKCDMDNAFRFGEISVTCEGYDYPEDPYVLKGSCGVSSLFCWIFYIIKFSPTRPFICKAASGQLSRVKPQCHWPKTWAHCLLWWFKMRNVSLLIRVVSSEISPGKFPEISGNLFQSFRKFLEIC